MLKRSIQIFSLILFLFNYCQKDWGTQRTDIYTSLDGPSYSGFFLAEFYDVNFILDPDALKIGRSINISADVKRNDNRNINVELFYRWYVNDSLILENGGPSVEIEKIITLPGEYTIKAHVYDEVVKHAFSNNDNPHSLDLVRKDLDKLQQWLEWSIILNL